MPEYYDIQRAATVELLQSLGTSSENFVEHVRHQCGSIILKITYGYNLRRTDDPYLKLMVRAAEGGLAAATHGSFWVDYFPVLRHVPTWFPGAGFKRKASKWKQAFSDLKEEPWNWVKQAVDEGSIEPSFVTRSIQRLSITLGEDSNSEAAIKNCAAMAYLAGEDTIVAAILTFILAMSLHPELQIRAQEELDMVIGSRRLPDFDDQNDLPFVDALIQETLRWNPGSPIELHMMMSTKDFTFLRLKSIYWDAEATVNHRAVMHDEKLYGANPHEFNPERFLQADTKPPNPELLVFGFGRRICPGRYQAMKTIYLTVAHLLATFTIGKAVDGEGNEVIPVAEFEVGFITYVMVIVGLQRTGPNQAVWHLRRI
ncbi:hypothetical protein PQX77_014315 [Marasmius sp. AFHP31]|nr:hypothetical protein PQX77_014315 [Marasmius sp. AFHP31]